MDAASTNTENYAVNFDLFTDEFEVIGAELNPGDTEDLPETLLDLIDTINDGNNQENSKDVKAFEDENRKQCFQTVTSKDLDELASETNAISTHWQTNWAVNVFRGKLQYFSYNFNSIKSIFM